MKHALIRNGLVADWRSIDPKSVPQHKLAEDGGPLLRPVVESDVPSYRQELSSLSTSIEVEVDRVAVTHSVVAKSRTLQAAAVKNEARRRILSKFPEWKQSNMTARGVELQDAWRRNGKWTADEQAEADELASAWAWIKAVRIASDSIETMEVIPHDYDSDARWP